MSEYFVLMSFKYFQGTLITYPSVCLDTSERTALNTCSFTSNEESCTVTLISQLCCRWSLCLLFSELSALLIIWLMMQV